MHHGISYIHYVEGGIWIQASSFLISYSMCMRYALGHFGIYIILHYLTLPYITLHILCRGKKEKVKNGKKIQIKIERSGKDSRPHSSL